MDEEKITRKIDDDLLLVFDPSNCQWWQVLFLEGAMSSKVNCFHISGAKVIEGIPYLSSEMLNKKPLPILRLGGVNDDRRVLLGRPRSLIGAAGCENCLVELTPEDEVPKKWMIHVNVATLNFGGEAFHRGLNLWPGGEWKRTSPLWRHSLEENRPEMLRKVLKREEIWALDAGQSLVLIDQFGGVRILKYLFGKVRVYEPTVLEMSEYISRRGSEMRQHSGAMWAWKNLELLRDAFPGLDLSSHLGHVRGHLEWLERKA